MRKWSIPEKICLCIFSTGFIWLGALGANQEASRLRRNMELTHSGLSATGHVVDYKMTQATNSGRIWPLVSFVTASGEKITFESLSRPRASGYSIGAAVPVLYDSRTLGIAEINEPERLWGGMMFQGLLSTVFILIGCGGLYIAMLKGQRES